MEYKIREADIDDLSVVVKLKEKMFKDIGMEHILSRNFIEMVEKSYKEMYENGLAKHYLAENGEEIVACSGGFIKSDIPYCYFDRPYYGFVGDVFVMADYRRKGLATKLTQEVINWLTQKEVMTIKLLASDYGRKVYENLGFVQSDEMILNVNR